MYTIYLKKHLGDDALWDLADEVEKSIGSEVGVYQGKDQALNIHTRSVLKVREAVDIIKREASVAEVAPTLPRRVRR